MKASQRQRVLLGLLVVVLVAVVIWQLRPSGNAPAPAAGTVASTPVRRGQATLPTEMVDVALDRLEERSPEPDPSRRSPFRYGTAEPEPAAESPSPGPSGPPAPVSPTSPVATGPPGPPPPLPI